MNLPRSTFYYQSSTVEGRLERQLDLQGRIEQIAFDYSGYGYRRITAELQRQGVNVNRKVVLKLMRQSDLLVRPLRA
jgi:putative transposase